jgi:hypothetical protein
MGHGERGYGRQQAAAVAMSVWTAHALAYGATAAVLGLIVLTS